MKMKTIIGIDPGSTTIGFGVISYTDRSRKPEVIEYGYIDLKSCLTQSKGLLQLNKDLKKIIKKHKPESIAVESIYFFKNSKTFTAVSEAKGVILLTAAEAQINVYEYTPLQIKQTISGYGKADKKIIQKLIQTSLNICSKIKLDDTSDALAAALCHLHHLSI